MEKLYRQGDVLLREVQKMPDTAKTSEDHILVRGETTGHAHSASIQMQVFRTDEGGMFLQGPGQLLHQEHKTIQVPEGTFEVVRQKEYSPLANHIVQD